MVENRASFPKAPLDERIVNSLFFPLQHLQTCLTDVQNGVVFEGEALNSFRNSNRACRNINIAVAAFSAIIASRLLGTNGDSFKGRLLKAGGLMALAYATHQVAEAYDKSQRQLVLDSLPRVSHENIF